MSNYILDFEATAQTKRVNNMSIDLDKIKDELKLLPNFKPPFFDQICLQGVEDNSDPFFGCDTIKSLKPYKETDFTELNFDLPYINSIIEELNMYRTRVLILKPKVCYSIHSDPVKRIGRPPPPPPIGRFPNATAPTISV